ncbi:MAG: ABC transporter permease [Sandaracinaceae bacterium]|nr:ABC transporter permease [Sandaracinaceae bacterium]
MAEVIVKRLLIAILVVFGALTTVFVLANGVGDPAAATLGPRAGREQLEAFRRTHGLDEPLLVRYGTYVANLARGDLGTSFRDNQPVARVVLTRLPRTVLLGTMAMFFELLFGLGLGTLAALRRNSAFDTGFMAIAFLGISAPSFLTGLIFLYVFSFRLGWFPIGGYGTDLLDHVYHGLLPAFTLAILGAATYARLMRSEMIETMRADFVRTARAKGLREWRVVLRHGVRNAMLPIVTLMGLSLPLVVSGALITETIYSWPGMGRLAIESIYSLDVPMILGVMLFASISVQAGNLLSDIAVASLDPRVRMGKR